MLKSTFEIYRHSSRGYSAVKVGWSSSAWLFTWLWAFLNGLWLIGFAFLFIELALSILIGMGVFDGPLQWFAVVIWFACRSYVSIKAGSWKVSMLENSGYEYCGEATAFTHWGAVTLARLGKFTKRERRFYSGSYSPVSL